MKFRNIEPAKAVNLANGQAYLLSAEMELATLVLTSFVSDSYYRSASDQLQRLAELVAKIDDKRFVAQLAIFARNEYGMRSITHALIGELACQVKSEEWLKYAIAKAIRRPDDILEIVAYYLLRHAKCGYKKGLSAALRKGIARALTEYNEYQLAKYQGKHADVKMVDIFNLIHPRPRKEQEDLYAKLISGDLKSTGTWESELSQAGRNAEESDLYDTKSAAWTRLIEEKKLGYFALLRNLRNIIEDAPQALSCALEQLTDSAAIKKSLVLPFRFLTAVQEIQKIPGEHAQTTIAALNIAADMALSNVPAFDGSTLIALDVSGSMNGRPIDIGSLFAACLAKNNPKADVLLFHTEASYKTINRYDSVLTTAAILKNAWGGGTDFKSIFNTLTKPYDRIIILSDMQAWVGYHTPEAEFNAYRKRTKANPIIHSFDLAGYGTTQFPAPNIHCYAGFSEKILDVMRVIEIDPKSFLKPIKEIVL